MVVGWILGPEAADGVTRFFTSVDDEGGFLLADFEGVTVVTVRLGSAQVAVSQWWSMRMRTGL